jgi:4Fe-4S single cluster domain
MICEEYIWWIGILACIISCLNEIAMTAPYCMIPWMHQLVRCDGSVKPCCVFKAESIPGYTRDDFMDGKFMKDLRSLFADGKSHPACISCKQREEVGKTSLRQQSHHWARQYNVTAESIPRPIMQEVNLTNLCNLKCRTCDQFRSTKWIADNVAMGQTSVGLISADWDISDEQLAYTKWLRFQGGEPLLHQDEFILLLTRMQKAGTLENLHFEITTNASLHIKTELIELLKNCKEVHISASIDGYASTNEYVRSDSKWTETVEVLDNFVNLITTNTNFSLYLIYTVSMLNVNLLEPYLNWIDSRYPTAELKIIPLFVQNPWWIDPLYLPHEFKNRTMENYSIILPTYPKHTECLLIIMKYLQEKPFAMPWADAASVFDVFKKKMSFLDQRRDTILRDINPELADIVGM